MNPSSQISLASPSAATTQKDHLADFDCWILEDDIITIPSSFAGGGCDENLMKTDYSEWLREVSGRSKNLVGSEGFGLINPPLETLSLHCTDNYFGVYIKKFTGSKQEKETLLKHQKSIFAPSSVTPPYAITKSIINISVNSARTEGKISYDGGCRHYGKRCLLE